MKIGSALIAATLVLSITAMAAETNSPTLSSTNTPPMGTTAFLDYKNGFHGRHFGQPLSEFGKLSYFMTMEPIRVYLPPMGEMAKIGEATASMSYGFIDSKLVLIQASTVNAFDTDLLLRGAEAAYGSPTHSSDGSGKMEWRGKDVIAWYFPNGEHAQLWIFTKSALEAMDLASKSHESKAAKDF